MENAFLEYVSFLMGDTVYDIKVLRIGKDSIPSPFFIFFMSLQKFNKLSSASV